MDDTATNSIESMQVPLNSGQMSIELLAASLGVYEPTTDSVRVPFEQQVAFQAIAQGLPLVRLK